MAAGWLDNFLLPTNVYSGSGLSPAQIEAAQAQGRRALAMGLLGNVGSGRNFAQGLAAGLGGAQQTMQQAVDTSYRNTLLQKQMDREERLAAAQERDLLQKTRARAASTATQLASGLARAGADQMGYWNLVKGTPEVQEMLTSYGIDPNAVAPEQLAQMQGQLAQLGAIGTPAPQPTDDLIEYEAMRAQGYQGTIEQFLANRPGAVTVNLGSQGLSQPPTGYYRPTPTQPGLAVEPGGPVDESKKQETEGTRAAAGFFSRMQKSSDLLDATPYVPSTQDFIAASAMYSGGGAATAALANQFMTPEGQRYYQAAADWVRAKLRKESGAVISPEEMQGELRTYFPVPNDSSEVIAQKRAARTVATDSMRKQAAFSAVDQQKLQRRANEIWREMGGSEKTRAEAMRRALREVGLAQ